MLGRSRLLLDARILRYNRSGLSVYLRQLYGAMARLTATGEAPPLDLTVLYHCTDADRALEADWPRHATSITPAHHVLERWVLAAELLRLRPALLHSPDHVCPQPLGWRTVVTVHDLAFHLMPETHSVQSRTYYDGIARTVRQATRIICVSQSTRGDLLAHFPCEPERVRVVYEAPGPAYTREGPAESSERPYFVFVGTIEPRKNVAGVVRALSLIPEVSRPELRLVGAPGPAQDEVAALVASLGLQRDVHLLGHRNGEEVARHYRGACGVVYPSLLEGFGLPILEAMACGAPVITSNRSSTQEVAGGAAELVNPLDPDAIAMAMKRLLEDDDHRLQLRRQGLTRAAEFTWERAARETLAVFQEALVA